MEESSVDEKDGREANFKGSATQLALIKVLHVVENIDCALKRCRRLLFVRGEDKIKSITGVNLGASVRVLPPWADISKDLIKITGDIVDVKRKLIEVTNCVQNNDWFCRRLSGQNQLSRGVFGVSLGPGEAAGPAGQQPPVILDEVGNVAAVDGNVVIEIIGGNGGDNHVIDDFPPPPAQPDMDPILPYIHIFTMHMGQRIDLGHINRDFCRGLMDIDQFDLFVDEVVQHHEDTPPVYWRTYLGFAAIPGYISLPGRYSEFIEVVVQIELHSVEG